jgi:hypothetical protein
MSFSNKSIDIVERLRECADLDESEYGEPGVVAMTREAADTIERLRNKSNNGDTVMQNSNAGLGELLSCPFCGGEAEPAIHLTYWWFAAVCKSCNARGPSVRIVPKSDLQTHRVLMNKANSLWNTRTPR